MEGVLAKVTDPDPDIVRVTVCAALTAGEVPLGIPNDKLRGDTETVCAHVGFAQSISTALHNTDIAILLAKHTVGECGFIVPPSGKLRPSNRSVVISAVFTRRPTQRTGTRVSQPGAKQP